MRVFVYRNLHKNQYSVRGPEGRIIDYTRDIILKNVKYCVGKKGRERVLREKRKNVHAGLRGEIIHYLTFCPEDLDDPTKVMYDPYKYKTFVVLPSESPIFESDYAWMHYRNEKPVIYAINSPHNGSGTIPCAI